MQQSPVISRPAAAAMRNGRARLGLLRDDATVESLEARPMRSFRVRVTGRAFEHLHAHRRVRAGIADHPRSQRGEATAGIAPDREIDADRMPLGMDEQRLLA